jgi:PAS domain-containing protein
VHKLLARQIAKATNEAGSVDLEKLFALITDAYADVDRDRRRTDRSMSLMIEEIDTVQRNLERTVIERTKELREREAELQAQNMRFAAAISHMSQGLVMFDSQTRLVICNQRFLAMYGLEADGSRAILCGICWSGGLPTGPSPVMPNTMQTMCGPWSKLGSRPRGSSS